MKSLTQDALRSIAMACHEINRAYCAALGDFGLLPWEQAPDWQKTSAINGVTFHINNPDAGPQARHESWWHEKKAAGWVYGAVESEYLKEHPCCVPFARLPSAQKARYHIFRATVHQAAAFFSGGEPRCEENVALWPLPPGGPQVAGPVAGLEKSNNPIFDATRLKLQQHFDAITLITKALIPISLEMPKPVSDFPELQGVPDFSVGAPLL